jgi:hypothetical protein
MSEPREHHGFFVGEAAGRVKVPLPELPSGVTAFTVPKPGRDDEEVDDRVPRDRKGRVKVARVDLLPSESVKTFELPGSLAPRDLIWILRTRTIRRWPGMMTQFGDAAWESTLELVRAGVGVLRCVVNEFDYHPHSFRLTEAWATVAEDHLAELTGRADPGTARTELLELMRGIPDLADERQLLADAPVASPLRVPVGSRARTTAWSVYDAAIRAACVWIPDHAVGKRHTAKELAAFAHFDSKRWTPERETAFANLIRMSFDAAVDDTDVEVLMRGPLQWRVGSVIADAQASHPWIGLPATGLRMVGTLDVSAVRGVLLVENKDTFQKVYKRPDIVDRWLCLWGQGYASKGLTALLSVFRDIPMAAWCDLDADGISIIANLSCRLDRNICPVGMDVDLWAAGPYRRQSPENLARGQTMAVKFAVDGPVSLRQLATAIADNGHGREQETLYAEVLPRLGEWLRALE